MGYVLNKNCAVQLFPSNHVRRWVQARFQRFTSQRRELGGGSTKFGPLIWNDAIWCLLHLMPSSHCSQWLSAWSLDQIQYQYIPIEDTWSRIFSTRFFSQFSRGRPATSRISPRSYPPTTERVDFIICGLKKSCLYQHHLGWWEGLECSPPKGVAPVVKVQLESSNLSISYQNCLYTYSYYVLYELSMQHNHAYYNYIIQCV